MPVGPAAFQRLDEALCLAVGSGRVWPGEALSDAVFLAEGLEFLELGVALGVIRQEALTADPEALEPPQRAAEEGRVVLPVL